MTMTVIDGDLPREVVRAQNLIVGEYRMPCGAIRPSSTTPSGIGGQASAAQGGDDRAVSALVRHPSDTPTRFRPRRDHPQCKPILSS
jgi:hypothetical protein